MYIEKEKERHKMRYEVRLVDYLGKENKVYPPILETENRKEAFNKMGYVKKHEHEAPFNEHDAVSVYENGVWIANMKLY